MTAPGTAAATPLCPACTTASLAWLDTKPSTLIPRLGFAHGSGAPYDVSAAGLQYRGRARHEEWRRTVQHSRRLIAQMCRAGHHA